MTEDLSDMSRIVCSFDERVYGMGLLCTPSYPAGVPKHRHKFIQNFYETPSKQKYRECVGGLFEAAIKYLQETPNLSQWQAIAVDIQGTPNRESFLVELELVLYRL